MVQYEPDLGGLSQVILGELSMTNPYIIKINLLADLQYHIVTNRANYEEIID